MTTPLSNHVRGRARHHRRPRAARIAALCVPLVVLTITSSIPANALAPQAESLPDAGVSAVAPGVAAALVERARAEAAAHVVPGWIPVLEPDIEWTTLDGLAPGEQPDTNSNKCSPQQTVCVYSAAIVTRTLCLFLGCYYAETGGGGGSNGNLKLSASFNWHSSGTVLNYAGSCSVTGYAGVGVLGSIQGCGGNSNPVQLWLWNGQCTTVTSTSNGRSTLLGLTVETTSTSASEKKCAPN